MPQNSVPQPLQPWPDGAAHGVSCGRRRGLPRCQRGPEPKIEHISAFLPHAQIGQPQLPIKLAHAHQAIGKSHHALHMGMGCMYFQQGLAAVKALPAHRSPAIE